jgi:hypothetical protein
MKFSIARIVIIFYTIKSPRVGDFGFFLSALKNCKKYL